MAVTWVSLCLSKDPEREHTVPEGARVWKDALHKTVTDRVLGWHVWRRYGVEFMFGLRWRLRAFQDCLTVIVCRWGCSPTRLICGLDQCLLEICPPAEAFLATRAGAWWSFRLSRCCGDPSN